MTGQIAENIAENLKQPWYNPLINSFAGMIGGFIAGSFTLIGVWMTLKYYQRRDEQNHELNIRSSKREEYKKVYMDFLNSIERININPNEVDVDDLTKSLNAIYLLGGKDVGNITGKIFNDYVGRLTDPQIRMELVSQVYNKIAPIMMQVLDDLQEPLMTSTEYKAKHWWQFWK